MGCATDLLGVGHLYSLGENDKTAVTRPQIVKIKNNTTLFPSIQLTKINTIRAGINTGS